MSERLTDEQRALLETMADSVEEFDTIHAALATIDAQREEIAQRKEELRLAQCPNPRDPEHGGHCETCSGLSVARTRQLHQQETRIAALEAENAALNAGVDDVHAELDLLDAEFIGFANGSHGHLRVKRALSALNALRKEGR